MAVLQFAFGGDAANAYLPHNLRPNGVVYPGTHDNDTTLGWYAAAGEKTRDHVRRYLRVGGGEVGWDFIRAAYAAVSRIAVIPMQDILSLGSEARFNSPGKPEGNWRWRLADGDLGRLGGGGIAGVPRRAGRPLRPGARGREDGLPRELNRDAPEAIVAGNPAMFADLVRLINRRPPADYERGFVREVRVQRSGRRGTGGSSA